MARSSASASSARAAQATDADGCAAATMPGFSPARSSASASLSAGSRIGSGPRRSPIGVMVPILPPSSFTQPRAGSLSSNYTIDSRRTGPLMPNPPEPDHGATPKRGNPAGGRSARRGDENTAERPMVFHDPVYQDP